MLSLSDLCSLLFTAAFVVGAVLVIALVMHKCSAAIDATKSSLEKRGWKVSRQGMSVPVGKRGLLDREQYLDATQRGLSKAANASTFGSSAGTPADILGSEHKRQRRHMFRRHVD